MHRPFRSAFVLLLCVALAGCGWWRNRRGDPPPAAPAVASVPAEPVAAPATEPPPAAGPSEQELAAARQVADDFYEMHGRMSARGLPAPAEMNAYAAFLCPSLVLRIGEAREHQASFIRDFPDEKPPLVEGDLFSSLFEGAGSAGSIEASAEGEGARVLMSLAREDGRGTVRWRDAVHLQRDQGVWCIADVEYRGDWPFANKGRLLQLLQGPF